MKNYLEDSDWRTHQTQVAYEIKHLTHQSYTFCSKNPKSLYTVIRKENLPHITVKVVISCATFTENKTEKHIDYEKYGNIKMISEEAHTGEG